MTSRSADGYVDDVPYPCSFIRELAPAWLDFVATLSGFEAPSRAGKFTWCELGCGQGLTAAVLAATHPDGEFHGIDVMPHHIDHARALVVDAGIGNLTLHAADFAAASDIELPCFDYIVAHGVYAGSLRNSARTCARFIDRRLKPGGLIYVSYNAMPGWTADAPFQYLVREIAGTARAIAGRNFSRRRPGYKSIRPPVHPRCDTVRSRPAGNNSARRDRSTISRTNTCRRAGNRSTSPRSGPEWRASTWCPRDQRRSGIISIPLYLLRAHVRRLRMWQIPICAN